MTRMQLHQQLVNAAMASRLPGLSEANHAAVLAELARVKKALADDHEDQPEAKLKTRLALSTSEMCVLMFLAAVAESHETADLVMRLAPHGLTTEALRRLVFGDAGNVHAFRELGAAGKLRKLCLITRNDGGSDELHESRQTWTVSDRVLAWLYGDESLDPSLSDLLTVPVCSPVALSIPLETVREVIEATLARDAVIVVHGDRGLGRRSLIAFAATKAEVSVFEIDAKRLATHTAKLADQLRLIARECKLLGRTPVICNIDELDAERIDLIGTHLVSELDTNVFVTCGVRRPQLRWKRSVLAIEVKPPTSTERAKLWRAQTPQGFPREVIVRAHREAAAARLTATDDAALCERFGIPVSVVQGSERALKITTEEDFVRAEALAGLRE